MNDYTVKMGFTLPAGYSEDDLYDKLYRSTKRSGLQWWIEGEFEDLGPADKENNCE